MRARNWVTFADHVVEVSVTSESAHEPSDSEVDRGEGLIFRDLTLTVDQVLWSAPDAPPAPDTVAWTAFGWRFEGSPDDRVEVTAADTPRLESGHSYIVAITHLPADCPGLTADSWVGLSEDGLAPVEETIVGAGEVEGREVSAAQARAERDPRGTLLEQVSGLGEGALVDRLERATADPAARTASRTCH